MFSFPCCEPILTISCDEVLINANIQRQGPGGSESDRLLSTRVYKIDFSPLVQATYSGGGKYVLGEYTRLKCCLRKANAPTSTTRRAMLITKAVKND